ncbi:hypothetical protein BOX15_Mlig027200g3 [Macrostomum lignano]|uniref:STAS domain-containing protein n=1 Tax=Macrostomum lignano TaxID=282301 RepID=A0A267GDE2_9PLAT|nr:hypothetical protein BOX15_Mlig027200g4 [Macrostomum lignano]PAA83394.1 hypothetical protein BOX15_Mlig027200g3 [Macrostomum lignano]
MKRRRKTYAGIVGRHHPLVPEEEPSESTTIPLASPILPTPAADGFLGVEGDDIRSATTSMMGHNMDEIVRIKRPVYSQHQFESIYTEEIEEAALREHFIDTVYIPPRPARTCIDLTCQYLPIIVTLHHYRWREYFPHDLLSGLSTGVMRIPQSMAYALLALVTPVHGLYTALVASLVYCVLGTSPHLVVTCQGVVSLLVGQVAKEYLERIHNVRLHNLTHTTGVNGTSADAAIKEQLLGVVLMISLLVGIFQLIFSVMRLGMLTNYLSDPLVNGFTTATAIEIILSQISALLGCEVRIPEDTPPVGVMENFKLIYFAIVSLPRANTYTLIISLVAMVSMAGLKRLNRFVKRRWKATVPTELIVVLMATLISGLTGFQQLGVEMVGRIPTGLPPAESPPPVSMDSILLRDILIIAIVSFVITVSLAKKFSLKYDNDIDANQEFLAYGAANILGSFTGCFVSTSSMTCSNLHESIGGRTQVANLIASGLVLITLLFLGTLFESTPTCILSAIIVVNLRSVLWQLKDLPALWRTSRIDASLWLVAFFAVIFTDANTGVMIGIGFSLITVIFRFQWPYCCVLGRIEHTDIYKNIALTPNAKEIDGIKMFRCEGPLFFSSADHFQSCLYSMTVNPRKLILQKRRYERRLRSLKRFLSIVPNGRRQNAAAVAAAAETGAESDATISVAPSTENHFAPMPETSDVHHVIIDMSCCSFIDSAGWATFNRIVGDFQEAGIAVYLCNCRFAIRAMLSNAGISRIDKRAIFLTNHDAVCAALSDMSRLNERDWLIYDSHARQRSEDLNNRRRHFVSRRPSDASETGQSRFLLSSDDSSSD